VAGGLARSNFASTPKAGRAELRAKGRRGPDRSGNVHVTALEIGDDSRKSASVTCRWKAPWVVVLARSSRTGGRRDLGNPNRNARAKAQRGGTGATGVSEVWLARERTEKHAVSREPGRARQSGSGVVKRQVHRSPGRGCKPASQGRGASLEEMPVADEARVLVVEAVGSRSRSYASVSELRSTPQGKL